MEETIIKYDDAYAELLFFYGRIDLLKLIPRQLALKLKLTDNGPGNQIYYRAVNSLKNCFDLLEYLIELNGHDAEINKCAMYYAVSNDRVEIIKWLIEKAQKWDSDTMDYIARQGKIEMLIFLNENKIDGCEECTAEAMDDSAIKGYWK